jgi:hypothetical protein
MPPRGRWTWGTPTGRRRQPGHADHYHRLNCAPSVAVRRRHLRDQTEQAWCLTIATNAISTWTAEYLGPAVRQFRDQGRTTCALPVLAVLGSHSEIAAILGISRPSLYRHLSEPDTTLAIV